MSDAKIPRVTVGLAVYNGENYLRQSIEAILAQTYSDFVLLIADNASTDATAEICTEYSGRDSRIHYHRHDTNIGVMANLNYLVSSANTPCFMWAAHDDRLAPTFIEKCLATLDADQELVLCHSLVRMIDGENRELGIYDSALEGADSPIPARRFAALVLSRHLCTDMFGLMRTCQLRRSELQSDYYGGDRGFLAEMSLLGRFAQVPEPLFENREHPQRCSRQLGANGGMTTWKLFRHYRRAIKRHVTDAAERRACRRVLMRWWFVEWNLARLFVDLIGLFWPQIFDVVQRWKVRFYGPLPQLEPGGKKKRVH